jgi:hypothetical protein
VRCFPLKSSRVAFSEMLYVLISGLSCPIGRIAAEINSDPWIRTVGTLRGTQNHEYAWTYNLAVSNVYSWKAVALIWNRHHRPYKITAHRINRFLLMPVIIFRIFISVKTLRAVFPLSVTSSDPTLTVYNPEHLKNFRRVKQILCSTTQNFFYTVFFLSYCYFSISSKCRYKYAI